VGGGSTGFGGGGGGTCIPVSPCDNVRCGSILNNCNQYVSCGCPTCSACDLSTNTCTGGPATTGTGLTAGAAMPQILPGTGGVICTQ
jgi:hypothetical protein